MQSSDSHSGNGDGIDPRFSSARQLGGILPTREKQPTDCESRQEIPVRFYSLCMLILVLFVASLGMSSQAQEAKTMRTGATPMVHMPGTPDCFVMATEQGDPSKEASILKMKGSA